ncbi:MAG: alpha-xylosidase [Kiritimatiellae bacterium]|nr:alpha-xylosidase [Kiritimatiellia bacterium]
MKFNNGGWLAIDGIDKFHPVEIYDVKQDGNVVEICAFFKFIKTKGDLLAGPIFSYAISSPLPDVLKVELVHYKYAKNLGPKFELHTQDASQPISLEKSDKTYIVRSGNMRLEFTDVNGLEMKFFRGNEFLTKTTPNSTSYIVSKEDEFLNEKLDKRYMMEQLYLSVGELVYGLGEHFTPFVKNGQTVDMWNEDGGTCSSQGYKNIPFYITNRNYGVFVNHTEKVSFEVASELVSKVQFSVPGERIEYYIIGGDSMRDVLSNYTIMTGKPALPPNWSFGLWLSSSFTTDYDEKTVMSFVDGMLDRGIPLQVFHFDCYWMKGFEWCSFEWDPKVFPDPKGMIERIHAKGLKVCVWINPYLGERAPTFKEAAENGYLLKRKDGSIWQGDLWQPGLGIIDFTNPAACEWYRSKLRALLDMGVDAFKTDFGERIPTEDVVFFDGSDPKKAHNFYTHQYNKIVFNEIKKIKGEKDAVVFARSATAGGQQFPVHWGGDCLGNYESMAESLRGGLSLCMSGFGFWSHDIGGFENFSTPDVFKRWVAFGLLSTHSRLHGSSSYRVPWGYDEEAVDVTRHFAKLKCRLLPYLLAQAKYTSETGVPMLRTMPLEFTSDPACAYLDRQYMLGESLLVAPVFREDGVAEYYLPKGRWTHLLTGEVVEGGAWFSNQYDYFSLPLFVRENSIIAFNDTATKSIYDYRDNVVLRVYELADGTTASAKVYGQTGDCELDVMVKNIDGKFHVSAMGVDKPFDLEIYSNGSLLTKSTLQGNGTEII